MISLSLLLLTSIVISDVGETHDLKSYISSQSSEVKKRTASVKTITENLKDRFPIKSKLSLKKINSYKISDKFKSLNMALISDEPASLNWLNRHYKSFKNNGTTIALIKTESLANYQNLNSVMARYGLNLALLDSSIFNGEITAYPVLIRNGVVSQ